MATAQQRSDFRADIGDTGYTDSDTGATVYAFTDDEIDRIYERVENDHELAVLLGIWQLLANAAKFYDYASGFTRQNQAVIYKNLADLYDRMSSRVPSIKLMGLEIFPYNFDEPGDDSSEDQLLDNV